MNILFSTLFFAALVLASTVSSQPNKNHLPFTWEDCGQEDRSIKFLNLVLAPLPLKFTKQSYLELTANFLVTEDITQQDMIEIKIRRLQKFGRKTFRIPLPCMDGVLGSCTLKFCDYFKDARVFPIFCALMKATGKECTCPIVAADYKSDKVPVNLDLSKIPLPAFLIKLGTGNYEIELKIKNPRGKEMGCYKAQTHVILDLA